MINFVQQAQELFDDIVFGNGWLALSGLVLVAVVAIIVRVRPGIHI